MADMSSFMQTNPQTLAQISDSTTTGFNQGAQATSKTADDATQTAIGLATMEDTIKQKKMATEKMADQLDQAKFDKLTGGINNITRADPKYRQAIADQVFKGFDRNGIAVDPIWRDALVKDDSTLNQMRQALPILMNRKADPQARQAAWQALGQYMSPTGTDGHDLLQHLIDSENKNQVTEADTQVRADATVESAKARAAATAVGSDVKEQNFEQRTHDRYVNKVINNQQLNNLERNQQGLQSALVAYNSSGGMAQELHTLQQAIRNNSQGTAKSGVEERASTYATDYGIKASQALQILTGNIQDTELSSPEIVGAIRHIAQKELEYQAGVANNVLNMTIKPGGTFYNKHPDLQEDFMNTVNERRARFGLNPLGMKSSPMTAPTGGGGQPPADPLYAKFQQAVLSQHPGTPEATIQAAYQKMKGK